MASNSACEAQAIKQNRKTVSRDDCKKEVNSVHKLATHAAKNSEWVNPRWPQADSYGIPYWNAMTSASGKIDNRAASKHTL